MMIGHIFGERYGIDYPNGDFMVLNPMVFHPLNISPPRNRSKEIKEWPSKFENTPQALLRLDAMLCLIKGTQGFQTCYIFLPNAAGSGQTI